MNNILKNRKKDSPKMWRKMQINANFWQKDFKTELNDQSWYALLMDRNKQH